MNINTVISLVFLLGIIVGVLSARQYYTKTIELDGVTEVETRYKEPRREK